MHTVSELLRAKSGELHTVAPGETVLEAARRMNDHKIGSLVVMEGQSLAGIVTERDILTRVVASERPPSGTTVEQVMTRQVVTCRPDARLDDLRKLMRERRIRHIPVVDAGRLVGMVSIGDVNAAEARALTHTISYLEAYITS